jgi:hypothetical protein
VPVFSNTYVASRFLRSIGLKDFTKIQRKEAQFNQMQRIEVIPLGRDATTRIVFVNFIAIHNTLNHALLGAVDQHGFAANILHRLFEQQWHLSTKPNAQKAETLEITPTRMMYINHHHPREAPEERQNQMFDECPSNVRTHDAVQFLHLFRLPKH